ncbi:MAG: diguanylate cyclase domain-containing protein [Microthrixaceae bacterium]
MRRVADIGFRRAAGALRPDPSTWQRVILARGAASLAIALAVLLLPIFEPNGLRLAFAIVLVEAVLNGAASEAVRRSGLPGLFLPVGDLALAMLIVATVPEVLTIAAIVFTSVNVLYVVWYGARAAAALAVAAVVGLGVIGLLSTPALWIPAVVCLAICSATSIVIMQAICVGVTKAQGRYEAILNGLDAVVWERDAKGNKTFVSDNVMEVVGTAQESFMGPGFLTSRVHPDDRSELAVARTRNTAGRTSESHLKVLDDDGAYRHLYERVSISRAPDGNIPGSRGLLVDESARWTAQAEIRRYSDFIAGIPTSLAIMRVADSNDPWSIEIVSMNPAAERMLGTAPAGTPLSALVPLPESWMRRLVSVSAGTEALERAFLEIPDVEGVFAVRVVPLPESHLGISIEDVTKRARLAESFRHQAHHDSLTGLANRSLLYERLSQVFDTPEPSSAALYVVDLDDFKTINDSFGHQYGDEVLTHFAARLSRRLRNCDMIARLGGDEFAIILTECHGEGHAADMASRVVDICQSPFDVEGVALRVGASVGVAVSPQHGTSGAELLRRADAAMYRAKFGGGGHVLYSPALDELGGPRELDTRSRGDQSPADPTTGAFRHGVTPQ